MNFDLLLKLVFAHVLADFPLQTDRICQGKKQADAGKYGYLCLHSLIHAVTAYLITAQWKEWTVPLVIFSTHFFIDFLKTAYTKKGKTENAAAFVVDQLAHLMVIIGLWLCLSGNGVPFEAALTDLWTNPRTWIVLTAYLSVFKPASVLISLFIRKWMPHGTKGEATLPNAGLWIGYLERALILTFIFTGHIEGIGFLLAAKSIFRFGELKNAGEIKITEYVLIGTLASFSVASLVGFAARQLL